MNYEPWHLEPVSTSYALMTDLLGHAKRVYVFHTTRHNGVRASYELCVRANGMRVIIVVVAVVVGSFLLLYR